MTKAKIVLSAVGVLTTFAGALAFKVQQKHVGTYFCTGLKTTATRKYATLYTSFNGTVTLYCTFVAGVSASTTYKVAQNP